mmetsp:Transcript_18606/g.27849  ORF Transcript_18606/g.27849 Transcript_18606/m.27849 type:complete len:86 (-) Transcript_18606:177-434(-)
MNTRIQNSICMKKILGRGREVYPGMMRFPKMEDGVDPFHAVSLEILRQDKIKEEVGAEDGEICSNSLDTEMEPVDIKRVAESFLS